jgi:hypothetical protein
MSLKGRAVFRTPGGFLNKWSFDGVLLVSDGFCCFLLDSAVFCWFLLFSPAAPPPEKATETNSKQQIPSENDRIQPEPTEPHRTTTYLKNHLS